jgi:cytosine/uracil/thiamine/allantoin permease
MRAKKQPLSVPLQFTSSRIPLTHRSSVPFGVVLVAGLYLTWPASFGRRLGGLDAIRRIDFFGNVLIIAACTLLVFALQEAGACSFAWNHPVIVLALVVSILSWVGFVALVLVLG